MTQQAEVKGCVIVLIGPTGATFTGTDFDASRAGGEKLKMAQERRAMTALCQDFIRGSCSEWMWREVDPYQSAQIIHSLVRKSKWQIVTKFIGHGEEKE